MKGSFRSGAFTLSCHLTVPTGSNPERRPAVILCHGFPIGPIDARQSGGTFPQFIDRIAHDLGYVGMTFNFRGTGSSTGDFSLHGWVDDLRTAIDFVVAEASPSNVVLMGTNTGGSIAICVAADDPRVSAAALLSPRADFDDWADNPRRFLEHARDIGAISTTGFPASFDEWSRAFRRFRPIEAARRFAPRPLLVMHGDDDESVPPTDARQLAAAHGLAELSVLVGAGHRLRHDPRAVAVLFGWLDRVRSVYEGGAPARAPPDGRRAQPPGRRGSLSLLTLIVAAASLLVPTVPQAVAAVAPQREVIALVVEGVGLGHGRGMSQWGAYGRAVNGRQSWQQILDAYYGGTTLGSVATSSRIRVHLMRHDGDSTVGVVSTTRRAMWRGVGYMALQARATATPNRYNVYASSRFACPGTTTSGWSLVGSNVLGPVTFTTTMNELSSPANQLLGLCHNDGSVTHYRGTLQLTRDSRGHRRVVNEALVETYLRGVMSREVSTSWGNAGGGAGMNTLRAQSVAARSYALSQNRYANSGRFASTCDSTACQLYGGAGRRATITSPIASGGTCESGNISFECANTNRAIGDTARRVRKWPDGRIVATEFSASNGPRTAGGVFPAINDPYDDVPTNPNHRWTRILDGDVVGGTYGLGALSAATTEADPATPFSGVWDNRVRLTGDNGTAVISGWNFRGAHGLPSPGFTIRAVTRDVVGTNSMTMIGDLVGLSVAESSNAELPALLDGVFRSSAYDSVPSRCTSGCTVPGVAAASSVPYGTDLVVVVLGYNQPTSGFAARIDAVMRALHARQVERVVWVNLSERSGRSDYIAANQALNAARSRWADLYIVDWRTHSAGSSGNRVRWFAPGGAQLSATGQAEMARLIRTQLLPRASFRVGSSMFARDQATGRWSVYSVNSWSMRERYTGTWGTGYDFVVSGDFDRDRAVDDLLVWARAATIYEVHRMSNYVPIFRTRGNFPANYDDADVGDFDSDGYVNDVLLWRHATGDFRIYSVAGFVPTLRRQSTLPTIYDEIIVGDLDRDHRIDDAFYWDRDSGAWVVRSFYQFGSTVRSSGTLPRGYDSVHWGDLDQDGARDDFLLIDFLTGTSIGYSWYAARPTFRATVKFSSTFDIATIADLDDDGDHNELLLFDQASRGWHIYTWALFKPTLARAGTWPLSYDMLVEGAFG